MLKQLSSGRRAGTCADAIFPYCYGCVLQPVATQLCFVTLEVSAGTFHYRSSTVSQLQSQVGEFEAGRGISCMPN